MYSRTQKKKLHSEQELKTARPPVSKPRAGGYRTGSTGGAGARTESTGPDVARICSPKISAAAASSIAGLALRRPHPRRPGSCREQPVRRTRPTLELTVRCGATRSPDQSTASLSPHALPAPDKSGPVAKRSRVTGPASS
ncbi:hypothetical protein HPB47_019206 [Ixodes persulcatus]|uniref:Uncharacterized protein n=1 Tax=Ixodes persulcatus TaxID=34615 RepID=A0AC60QJ20_IXOPE|nr:hypothetical protein HPB47_019206 [Ixodes persulcatus]